MWKTAANFQFLCSFNLLQQKQEKVYLKKDIEIDLFP